MAAEDKSVDEEKKETPQTLREKIENHTARVAVIGLGYVGLPLAVEMGKVGFDVTGVDTSARKVELVASGKSDVLGISEFEVAGLKAVGKLSATQSYDCIDVADVVVVCVPTPLDKTRDPDVSFILSAFGEIKSRLHGDQLVILESTTYPGTTYELVLPLLEESGLKAGQDFYLAFSPERVDPGNQIYTITNTPKVVGGITEVCTEVASHFYQQLITDVVPVSSTQAAEMAKLLENTFRSVNIGLVNEVALMCDRLDIDVWEVIDAAATKPFGFMPFYPGPGLGGHCIPIDPHYLAWKLKTLDFNARFIELASEVTRSMPAHVVSKVVDVLNDFEKSLKGSSVLILGATYKPDVGDVRESPALDILEMLQEKGAKVSYHDPFIPKIQIDMLDLTCVDLDEARLKKADCVVITTHHSAYDYEWIVQQARCVVDTRNATKHVRGAKSNVVKL
ncbi:MAG: nucleotide sugar dehydrogenase [Candidatus Latescibacteria bacterium]|nr:nucleotide sugar dehydrogenase [Candidatus Latescibacterota bacterium]